MGPIVVIGAGAAGVMASRRAAELGAQVLLLEKTPRIGTKILISGGGKCNITHAGSVEDVLAGFRANEARFLRPAFHRFSNRDIVSILTQRGLRIYTRPDGRIFPVDRTARDVVAILRRYLEEVRVDIRLDKPVRRVLCRGGRITGVELADETIACERVIIATGGSSYPNSGTTGDGFRFAADLGHTLEKIRGALAPISLRDNRWSQYSGISLRNVILRARQQKEFARWSGDLLLTHFGISGPCALEISRSVSEHKEKGKVSIEVDLFPDESFEHISATLAEMQRTNPQQKIATYVERLLASRIVPEFLHDAEIPVETIFSKLNRRQRNRLSGNLKGWCLGTVANVMVDRGEVVAGGVTLDEVDSQTMRSRRCSGLYLCGEVLDIAGSVGGYNLQAAFSTGYVAGETAARD
jgi:predicted Rossmann fold flavoprotein